MKTKREPRLEIRYKGRIARRSAWRGSKRWYALTESATGCQIDERHCPQFDTEAEFREWARRAG
jgi:hypothetical protein